MHSSQKEGRVFCISCGDTSPALQFQRGIFDNVPKAIKIFIVRTQTFPTFVRWDDRVYTGLLERLDQRIAIISLICQKVLGIYSLDKPTSLRTICNGTCCNKPSDRHIMRIHGRMYLRVEPFLCVSYPDCHHVLRQHVGGLCCGLHQS